MHTPFCLNILLMRKCARLRIEFLIQQMAFRPQIASHADALHFFRNAGDLLDVTERGEVRTDTLKSWNASSVSCSHGQKCRASIRSALTSCATS